MGLVFYFQHFYQNWKCLAKIGRESSGWCKNVTWSSEDRWYSGSFYKGLLWKWRTDGTNKLTFYVDCKGIVLTRASRLGEWSAAWHHSRRRRWRGTTRSGGDGVAPLATAAAMARRHKTNHVQCGSRKPSVQFSSRESAACNPIPYSLLSALLNWFKLVYWPDQFQCRSNPWQDSIWTTEIPTISMNTCR